MLRSRVSSGWLRRRPEGCHTVGIVGAGAIALDIHLPVLLNRRDVNVAWVADPSPTATRRARRRFGIRTIVSDDPSALPECDAVLLAIPVGIRGPYHAEFARRGTLVYAEKPFATTLAMAHDRLAMHRSQSIVCGFQRRAYPNVRSLTLAAASGEHGSVRRIVVREGARTRATGMVSDFRDDAQLSGGGILMDLGCHGVDLAHHLTGANQSKVVDLTMLFDERIDREVSLRALLKGDRGAVMLEVELSWLRDLGRELVVEFERATLRTGPQPNDALVVAAGASTPPQLGLDDVTPGSIWGAVSLAWSALFSGSAHAAGIDFDPSTCLPTISLIDDAYRAARSQ